MGSFLDKVGLQHFVEKVKNLLSGYLPLSGGDISGTLRQTMHEGGAEISTTLYKGFDYYYSTLTPDNTKGTTCAIRIDIDGIVFNKNVSTTNDEYINTQAYFDTEKCNTKKFVLSGDPNQGLIANDSETVVPEVASSVIDEVVQNKGAEYTDAGYVSKANLGRLVKNLYNNISTNANDNSYTIMKTTGVVKITTSNGEVTIPAKVNYHIDGDYKITSGKENIHALIQSGTAREGNKYFEGLKNLLTIDVSKLNVSNVVDFSNYFRGCSKLFNFYSMGITRGYEISFWATKKAKTFGGMFTGCSSLTGLRLDSWDTRNVGNMMTMFAGCIKLETLHLEGWNTQSVNLMSNMFSDCSAITSLYLSEGFGRMNGSVGTLDLSALTNWINSSVKTLLELYNRKANGMSVITIKLSSATKNALGSNGISTLTAKGYTIA